MSTQQSDIKTDLILNKFNPTNYGQLCYCILYTLLRKVFEHSKYIKDNNTVINLQFESHLSEVIRIPYCYNDTIKKQENEFKLHTLLYGSQIEDKYTYRNNTKEFWASHWGFSCSPIRAAQNILSNVGAYLSDNTTLSDRHLKLSIFFIDSNKNNQELWHKNNTFRNISINTDNTTLSFDVKEAFKVLSKWEKILNNICGDYFKNSYGKEFIIKKLK